MGRVEGDIPVPMEWHNEKNNITKYINWFFEKQTEKENNTK